MKAIRPVGKVALGKCSREYVVELFQTRIVSQGQHFPST